MVQASNRWQWEKQNTYTIVKKEHRIKPVHRTILNNGGFQNFQMKLLKEVDDLELLHLYEKKIIDDYKNNPDFKLMNTHL